MSNHEIVELPCGGDDLGFDLADVAVHALLEGIDDAVHFAVIAFHDQFDPAVVEVTDVAMHVVAHGNILRGVSEPDTLNSTAEMVDAPLHLVDLQNHLHRNRASLTKGSIRSKKK